MRIVQSAFEDGVSEPPSNLRNRALGSIQGTGEVAGGTGVGQGGAGRFPGEVGGGEGAISGVRRALRSLPDPNQHRCAVIR